MDRKHEKLVMLCAHVLRLEMRKGHGKWKVTDLAKTSGVARSTIYASLGSKKAEMIRTAVTLFLEDFYGLSPQRRELVSKKGRLASFMKSRELLMNMPELLLYYFHHHGLATEAGKAIRAHEQRYMESLADSTGVRAPADLRFLRACLHGISVSPFLSEKEAGECVAKLFGAFTQAEKNWGVRS